MIYEVRTYTMTVGSAGEAVADFGRIIEERQKLSRLIGFFQSASGDLNRIMHIWEYENSGHRESVRAETLRQPWWPPLKVDKILHQATRLMRAAPFCPEPRTGNLGTVYEVRSDNLFTGKMPALSEQWAKHLPEREKLSPLAAAFANRAGEFESGILNEFLHIWPYRDMNHWAEVQAAAEDLPGWRECSAPFMSAQRSEIWLPADYSPMN